MPIITLKLTAFTINDQIMLTFVKVLDKVALGQEILGEIGEQPPVNRSDWVKRTSEDIVSLIDATESDSSIRILGDVLKEIESSSGHPSELKPKYTRNNIIIQDSKDNTIMSFVPRRKYVLVYVGLGQPDQVVLWEDRLDGKGIYITPHANNNNWLSFRLTKDVLEQNRELLKELFKTSYKNTQDD